MRKLLGRRSRRAHAVRLRPKVLIKKMYWEFHKGDDDFNPSVPHGHSLDGKYKLELWSGIIYEVLTGKSYGVARSKDMQRLFTYDGFQEFVEKCRSEYAERHPGFVLPDLTPNKGFSTEAHRALGHHRRLKAKRFIFCTEYETM